MSNPARFIFIFLDGVGIGRSGKNNPFFSADVNFLSFFDDPPSLPDKSPIKAIDARLGVKGIPMSATGQTSLFTGINIPAILNCHKDSYPDNLMRKIIKNHNIFSQLLARDFKVRFLNAYPDRAHLFTPEYMKILDDGQILFSEGFPLQMRGMISVTSCMMLSSRMTPFGVGDILLERSLYHDFSNRSLWERGLNLPQFSPEKAAEIIFNTSGNYDFLLYEFFQTDMFGHGYSLEECVRLIKDLDKLIKHLISLLEKEKDTLIVTSDHGNLEDYSTRLHTTNPVPLIAWGYRSDELRERINSIIDVTPAIIEFFKNR